MTTGNGNYRLSLLWLLLSSLPDMLLNCNDRPSELDQIKFRLHQRVRNHLIATFGPALERKLSWLSPGPEFNSLLEVFKGAPSPLRQTAVLL
jgi:hypothetical protein